MITLTQSEYRAILKARYPNAYIVLLDSSYNIPTDLAIETFRDELADHLRGAYGDKWESFFDCDNFSLEAIVLAYRKHYLARKAGAGSAESVTIGLLCYTLGSHALTFRLQPDRSVTEFEPQNRRDVLLTKLQCESAWLVFG